MTTRPIAVHGNFMRTTKRATIALVAVALLLPKAAHAERTFSSFTVFGDSFSDTGNLRAVNGFLGALFIPARQSNGEVWTDYFARSINRSADAAPVYQSRRATGNYSVAGARTTSQSGFPATPSVPQQVQRWAGGASNGMADPTGLYAVFGGANDIRTAGALGSAVQRQQVTVSAARSIVQQAGVLADRGAGFVLIPNTVNLGLVPEAQGIPNRPGVLTELSALFNLTLADELALLRASRPQTTFFDFSTDILFENVLYDAARGGGVFGISDVTTPCRNPGAASCDVSLFWDNLHPTTRAHDYVARAIYDRVVFDRNVARIPEPASLALLVTGVVVLGAARLRRRALAA